MLKQVWLWPYERGTWQYDIIVGLILAFIFFTPRTLFNTEKFDKKILAYGSITAASSQEPTEEKKYDAKKSKGQKWSPGAGVQGPEN